MYFSWFITDTSSNAQPVCLIECLYLPYTPLQNLKLVKKRYYIKFNGNFIFGMDSMAGFCAEKTATPEPEWLLRLPIA